MRYSLSLRYALLGIVFAAGHLCANDDNSSRKTFLSPRAAGVNLAMEYSTWHNHVFAKPAEGSRSSNSCDPCGRKVRSACDTPSRASFQVTGFYQDSTNHGDIARYFGIGNNRENFIVGTQASIDAREADILNRLLIHKESGDSPLVGNVSFKPNQQMAGVRFDYFQDFNTPINGLFFKARMPLVWVEREMKLQVAGSANADSVPAASLQDFFAGKVEQADLDNLQGKLTKAKIDGRRHKFGVADIDLAIGHKCVHTETKHLFLNFGITIPTGSKVRGEYLFEPVCGNGQHFGIGGGLDAGVELWSNCNAALRFLVAAEYRYLFEKTEERTVGVKDRALGYYFLAAQEGQDDVPLFPAANILTQGLKVKPGSQLDALVAFAFNSSGFTIDFGYNMFWKDSEDVWLKNWKDDTYALANANYVTSNQFDSGVDALQTLNRADLDVAAAATPSLFTHKLFAGLGYTMNIYQDYPLSFGIGGSYEFGTSNADLENYAVWAKIAVSV